METIQEPEAFTAHPCELIPNQKRLTRTVPEPGLTSYKTPSLHFPWLSIAQQYVYAFKGYQQTYTLFMLSFPLVSALILFP